MRVKYCLKKMAIAACVICLLIFFSSIISQAVASSYPSALSDRAQEQRYYTSIEVQKGDTLWKIEEKYNTIGHMSADEYIQEIQRINHLSSSTIHIGGHLIVYYWA